MPASRRAEDSASSARRLLTIAVGVAVASFATGAAVAGHNPPRGVVAGHQVGTAAAGGDVARFSAPSIAAAKPVVASDRLKLVNRLPALAIDPTTGNGVVAWNQVHSKKNNFGRVYAAALTWNGSKYAVGAPVRVSGSGTAQRPAVAFLPELGVYQILWDTGPRDLPSSNEPASAPANIVSSIFDPGAPAGGGKRAGKLMPPVTLVSDGNFNSNPAIDYIGPSTIFERSLFHYAFKAVGSSRAPVTGGDSGVKNAHTDVENGGMTQVAPPEIQLESSEPNSNYWILESIKCGDLTYHVINCAMFVGLPDATHDYGVLCLNPKTGKGTYTPFGYRDELDIFDIPSGSIRAIDERCDKFLVLTPLGTDTFDASDGGTKGIQVELSDDGDQLLTGNGHVLGPVGGFQGRSFAKAGPTVYVNYEDAKRSIRSRVFSAPTSLGRPNLLWKIKKKRMRSTTAAANASHGVVAWAENSNRRGTKSRIQLGWFPFEQ